jgi:hypothetical protein
MSDAKFSVSRPAQRAYKVLGGARPSSAQLTARDALAKAHAARQPAAIHVTPRKEGWAVKTEGRGKAASIEPTKANAVHEARKTAADRGARLIEHSADGRIAKNTKPIAAKPKAKSVAKNKKK